MTYHPGLPDDPTAQQPTISYPPGSAPVPPPAYGGTARTKRRTLPIVLGIIAAFLVLCCAGGAIAAAVDGSGTAKPTSPAPAAPVNVTSPSASQSPIPSPAVTTPAADPTTPTADATTADAATTAAAPPPPAGPPTHSGSIMPGAFCKVAEEGWIGYSGNGTAYVCRDVDNDGHPHWVRP